MFRRSHFSSIVMMMVGGLLGSAGASAKLNPFHQQSSANAASGGLPALQPSEIAAPGVPNVGSCDDAKRGELLALATHNESIQENAVQAGKKPNILVIFGDDIGITNISAYSDGLMGYATPNIDRIAKEGHPLPPLLRRASLHRRPRGVPDGPARHPHRTDQGRISRRTDGHEPARPLHRRPAQEPRLRDRAVRQEPRRRPQRVAADRQRFRRVLRQPLPPERRGRAGAAGLSEGPGLPEQVRPARRAQVQGHRHRTTPPSIRASARSASRRSRTPAPLTKKRMETIDDETSAAAIDYMKRQQAAGKPFFCWFNATRMHLRTHVRAEHRGRYKHGDSEYIDGMIEHDETIGTLLKALDDMGIADNTIVVYTSDNGPHMNTWPDGAMTPFRSEKNTNWEGAFRVPCLVRWPGVIKPGTVTNELMSHNDWVPTLCSIAGEPDIVGKCMKGYTANGINYKVHLDGYDQSAFLRPVTGTAANNSGVKSARDKFFYTDDDGLLVGLRQGDYKYVFAEQRLHGHDGGLGGAFHEAAPAEDLQPVPGPVRAGGHHVQHLLGLEAQPHLPCLRRERRSGEVRRDVQGVPAALDPAELLGVDDHGRDAAIDQGSQEKESGGGPMKRSAVIDADHVPVASLPGLTTPRARSDNTTETGLTHEGLTD